jgi:putative toxin-antitoxin system antitoxin component (TIGR02293 family)
MRRAHLDKQPMPLEVLTSVFDVIELQGERLVDGAIPAFAHHMKIPCRELCALLSVAPLNRGQKLPELLGISESAQLIRIVKAFNRCIEIFGDADKASVWLKSPYFAFRGATPLSLFNSAAGVEKIMNELERIGHETFIAGVVF